MKRHRKMSFLLGERSNEGHSLGVNSTAHLSDGRVLTAGRDGTVRLWDCLTPTTVTEHGDTVNDILIPPSSNAVVSCSSDNSIFVTSLAAPFGSLQDERVAHTDSIKRLKMVSSSTLLSASLDGNICIHDLRSSGQAPTVVSTGGDPLFAMAVGANDGRYAVFAGSAKGHMYFFDPRALTSNTKLEPAFRHAHRSCIRDLSFVDGGSKLVSAGADGLVKLWDTRMLNSAVSTMTLHTDAVFSLCPAPNSPTFLSASRDGTISATNVRTLHTSRIVSCGYPIFHISISQKNVLYAASCKSSVDAYVLSNLLHSDAGSVVGYSDTPSSRDDIITPSKVSINVDLSPSSTSSHRNSARSPFAPLTLIDSIAGKLESPFLRRVEFSNAEEEQQWCTPSARLRPKHVSNPDPEPDITLPGSTKAIMDFVVLNDKRHVVTVNEEGEVKLWNLCTQSVVKAFPIGTTIKEALETTQVDTHCPSWCTVECRWGTLCVTLAFETFLDAVVNEWWLRHVQPASPLKQLQTTSVARLSRKDRLRLMEKPLVSLGEVALRNLFDQKKLCIVVWSLQSPQITPQGLATRYYLSNDFDLCLKSAPSWVSSLMISKPGSSINLSTSSTVSVEFVPMNKSVPVLKPSTYSIAKRKCIYDVAADLVATLKIKLPKTRDFVEALEKASVGDRDCILPVSSGELQDTEVASSSVLPDEFIEFLAAGDDGNPSRLVEPMMMIVTAFYVYKEKGSGTLRLWYRKHQALGS